MAGKFKWLLELITVQMAGRTDPSSKGCSRGEMSIRRAAEIYDLPKSTLYDHTHGHKTKCRAGRLTILTELEEKTIVRSCQELAQLGFGIDRHTMGAVVRNYLLAQGRETPFKDGVPGRKWWTGFLRRWPSLSERKPQHFPSNRAEASTPEAMDSFFQHLTVKIYILWNLRITDNFGRSTFCPLYRGVLYSEVKNALTLCAWCNLFGGYCKQINK